MTKHDRERGQRILDVIDDFTAEYGAPPTIRAITARVGLASTSATHHWITRLIAEGQLAVGPNGRGLRVLAARIPDGICQRPGCGNPIPEKRAQFRARWCSNSCHQIAGHVRRWVRAMGAERLVAELGL